MFKQGGLQMQERTLENLILEDDDYIFGGDLIINGDVKIKNGNLIVSGTIIFAGDDASISIEGGDIVCENLGSRADILIRDGDICVKSLVAQDIDSDGNVEVNGDSDVCNIHALNYLVAGDNHSYDITTMQDFYVLGRNDSWIVNARDVLFGNNNSSDDIQADHILIEGNNDSHEIKAHSVSISGNNDSCQIEADYVRIDGDCCNLNHYNIIAKKVIFNGKIIDGDVHIA